MHMPRMTAPISNQHNCEVTKLAAKSQNQPRCRFAVVKCVLVRRRILYKLFHLPYFIPKSLFTHKHGTQES